MPPACHTEYDNCFQQELYKLCRDDAVQLIVQMPLLRLSIRDRESCQVAVRALGLGTRAEGEACTARTDSVPGLRGVLVRGHAESQWHAGCGQCARAAAIASTYVRVHGQAPKAMPMCTRAAWPITTLHGWRLGRHFSSLLTVCRNPDSPLVMFAYCPRCTLAHCIVQVVLLFLQ